MGVWVEGRKAKLGGSLIGLPACMRVRPPPPAATTATRHSILKGT